MASELHSFVETTDGISIHCASMGKGPLILFLHGFPEFWYQWINQLRHFSAGFLAVAPDLRGYNFSSKPESPQDYQISKLVEDVRFLALHFTQVPFVLVGHDWGGATALHVARSCPEQLRSAVVLNTNYWRTHLMGMWHLFFLNLPIAPRFMFSFAPRMVYRAFLMKTFNHPDRVSAEAQADYLRMFSEKRTTDFWIRLYRNMAKSLARQASMRSLRGLFKVSSLKTPSVSPRAFQIPITLIWGADDTFNPLWIAKDLHERLIEFGSRVKLEIVPDAGHFVTEEQAEGVAKLISRHLDAVDQPACVRE